MPVAPRHRAAGGAPRISGGPLTRICNWRAFDDYPRKLASPRTVFGQSATLLLADVDHFKTVNDTRGHLAGDAVLQALAESLVRGFPRRNDFVARIGGEGFAVLLPETSARETIPLTERFLEAFRALGVPYHEHMRSVTVSLGVAEATTGEPAGTWLDRADRALFRAKRAGRNRLGVAETARAAMPPASTRQTCPDNA